MLRTALMHVEAVRAVMRDPTTPRGVLQAAWSTGSQRADFEMNPSVASVDITANTNKLRRPLMQMTGTSLLPACRLDFLISRDDLYYRQEQ
jgi:hypothetical protein